MGSTLKDLQMYRGVWLISICICLIGLYLILIKLNIAFSIIIHEILTGFGYSNIKEYPNSKCLASKHTEPSLYLFLQNQLIDTGTIYQVIL